ncbi:MAG: adenine phosphoribosyltransferase [Sphaerochaetaceae bacterium]|jgi:adenine phosphoribosyltransferase|nr:adenine phosphoribosyltransferase [Sphaerochaetaceae bacterium]MDD3366347.1 adenine phosphoribosyltransferase [Sphaerochaetaceae bacterium]MDD4218926.1 adenine phosphoribosyltransferase [Sphaerochaetaceae bacterium]MDY0371208.1 adenine phosphoribosyltransferase [Sphaerochaetaceae bacterium]
MDKFDLDSAIRKIHDFPRAGILFYDITSILTNPTAFKYCIDRMCEMYQDKNLDAIACVEARGFVFAAPFAYKMGLPLILVRKKGKLPGKTRERKYNLEYGQDYVSIHESDVTPGSHILIVDDLIATGGTIKAAAELIEEMQGVVDGIFGVIGLPFLDYEKVLPTYEIQTLITYDSE